MAKLKSWLITRVIMQTCWTSNVAAKVGFRNKTQRNDNVFA